MQARSWAELPIDPQIKDSLTKKELEQQQAIWEFIYTEHSHLRNLDVIINVRPWSYVALRIVLKHTMS
jgi:hypothetical protein